MVEQVLDQTVLIYGFALFFIFFVLIILIIRYSNKELVKKLTNIYEKLKNTEKDMRQLAEAEMRGKRELRNEIHKLREELEELRSATEKQKQRVSAK